GNFTADRAGKRYSGAGHVHGRANDGVDHGYVLHDEGIFDARRGDGQAAFDWRVGRTQRGDGARMPGGSGRSVPREENVDTWLKRGDSGIWQRGVTGREAIFGEKSARDCDQRFARWRFQFARNRSAEGDAL